MGQSEYKIFGHRGCRGIYTENTIEGFKKAIAFGVDGIELDVVVNKNQELVISHESYIDTNYCLTNKLDDESLNIYKMNILLWSDQRSNTSIFPPGTAQSRGCG